MTLVGPIGGERHAQHTEGYPLDPSKMLPVADVLVLIADGDPGAMVYRYTAHGELAGDTWHESVAEALDMADEEYSGQLLGWIDIPSDVGDPHAFSIQYAADRLNQREGR